jgi:transcriptional regulator with XRE-family HTH domain
MPEIGATLREARMRQHIDIADVEARTKIRAKYLRALENEEWELLPGPTFVKSFLRTYADELGLDSRLLIEEFKLRHERLAEHELLPITPAQRERERERRRRGPGIGRDVAVAGVVVALIALLIVLGRSGGGGDSNKSAGNTVATTPTTTPSHTPTTTAKKAPARFARLQLRPSAPVWVCVEAAGNRKLVSGQVITPSTTLPVWRSTRFVMTFGNGNLTMRVNGRTLSVPAVSKPIGYVVDRAGHRKLLPAAQQPTCA